MKTYYKERVIGKVLAGLFVDQNVRIYNTDFVIIGHPSQNVYVNKDTVISYKDIATKDSKSLGGSLVGNMLFGVSGALAMGNKIEYTIEITWASNKKSMIVLYDSIGYQFFLSKLYEHSQNVKVSLNEFNKNVSEHDRLFLNYEKEISENVLDNIPKFFIALPSYRAQYEKDFMNFGSYAKCRDEYGEFYKSLRDKLDKEGQILGDKFRSFVDYRVIEKYEKNPEDFFYKQRYMDLKKEKDPDSIKKMYTDEEIELLKGINGHKDILKPFLRNYHNYMKDLHLKEGYIYLSEDRDDQLEEIQWLRKYMHGKVCDHLETIINNNKFDDYDISYAILPTQLLGLIKIEKGLPTHYIISAVVNSYFGKNNKILMEKFNPTLNKLSNTNQNVSSNDIGNKYDNIKKLKELLDMGAITQQEFDEEKNKLLKN